MEQIHAFQKTQRRNMSEGKSHCWSFARFQELEFLNMPKYFAIKISKKKLYPSIVIFLKKNMIEYLSHWFIRC